MEGIATGIDINVKQLRRKEGKRHVDGFRTLSGNAKSGRKSFTVDKCTD